MALIKCPLCGRFYSDTLNKCPQCGATTPSTASASQDSVSQAPASQIPVKEQRPCPETHLGKAILVTILCCWPFGIPAIVNAASVSNAFTAGDYNRALENSEKANKWCKYSIIAAAIFWTLYIIAIVILGGLLYGRT